MIFWEVRCINSETKEVFNRELFFDPPQNTSKEIVGEVIKAANSKSNLAMVPFRHLFREVDDEEMSEF